VYIIIIHFIFYIIIFIIHIYIFLILILLNIYVHCTWHAMFNFSMKIIYYHFTLWRALTRFSFISYLFFLFFWQCINLILWRFTIFILFIILLLFIAFFFVWCGKRHIVILYCEHEMCQSFFFQFWDTNLILCHRSS